MRLAKRRDAIVTAKGRHGGVESGIFYVEATAQSGNLRTIPAEILEIL